MDPVIDRSDGFKEYIITTLMLEFLLMVELGVGADSEYVYYDKDDYIKVRFRWNRV